MNFFSDLDNTLIYSHRKNIADSKIVVEWLNGKRQSFMTEKTYTYLSNNQQLNIIPVTTRSVKQCQRLSSLFEALGCKYVLACNGAVLLENSTIDNEWLNESKELASTAHKEFEEAVDIVESISGKNKFHIEDTFLIYGKANSPQLVVEKIASAVDLSRICVFCDSSKFYCVPRVISKGNALQRFARKYQCQIDIAAGDGYADISMLNEAYLPILPHTISGFVRKKNAVIAGENKVFSDVICEAIENAFQKQQLHF